MSKKLLNLLLIIMMLAVLVPTTLAAPPAQEEGQDYIVTAGDWLSKLAEKYLGNPFAYPAIVEYTNQKHAEDDSYAEITAPDLIEVGWKIYIPSAEEAEPTPEEGIGVVQPDLSTGILVQPGEYEAIGTIPGCTATLITNNLVLTAAHCVCPGSSPNGCATRTTFTLKQVFPVDDPNTAIDESKTRQDVSVAGTVRVHPEFGQRGWNREDIAVVVLDQPITQVAPSVTPIPVEESHNTPLPGNMLTLVGYGVSGTGCSQPSVGKQKLSLAATASDFARIMFRYNGQHVCPGDSGGPVLNSAGHVVGVASWGNFSDESTYRPTSFSYNWIFDIPRLGWSSCSWVKVEQQGINSHQPGPAWCPDGSFLVAFDLDGDRAISAHDAPVIGQAQCCKLAGAETTGWNS